MLAHLDKGHTRADVVEALVWLTREAGIALRPTWVAFTPWTTLDDYRAMLDFVEAEGLVDHVDPVQYSLRLLVPPGSLLARHPGDARPTSARWSRARSPTRWTHPDPRMDAPPGRGRPGSSRAAAEAHADDARHVRPGAGPGRRGGRAPRAPAAGGLSRPDRARPPRLTEPWFC